MKFKKKHIIMIAGLGLFGFIVAGILLLSGPRMRNQPSLRSYEFKMRLPAEEAVRFQEAKPEPGNFVIPESTQINLERGAVYYRYYCIFCHGEKGDGNGPVGESYLPKPASLHSDSLRDLDFHELYKISFSGTGHSPVLERVVKEDHKTWLMLYLREAF